MIIILLCYHHVNIKKPLVAGLVENGKNQPEIGSRASPSPTPCTTRA